MSRKAPRIEPALSQSNKRTVLVVEDTPRYAKEIVKHLKAEGFSVVLATTLSEAKEKFNELKDTLAGVVTDIYFPRSQGEEAEVSGLEFIGFVKGTRPDLYVIAQSSLPEYLEGAKACGADAMMNKSGLHLLPTVAKVMLGERKTQNHGTMTDNDPSRAEPSNPVQAQHESQDSMLVITESLGLIQRLEFKEGSDVETSNLSDAGSAVAKKRFSKILVIGTLKYFYHARHDIGHWDNADDAKMVFLQTDGEPISHALPTSVVHLSVPIDTVALSKALGTEVALAKVTEEPVKKSVLLVTDWDVYAKSIMRALGVCSSFQLERCSHAEFAKRTDIGQYGSVLIVDDKYEGEHVRSRNIMCGLIAAGCKTKSVYLTMDEMPPVPGETCIKQPVRLTELILVLGSDE